MKTGAQGFEPRTYWLTLSLWLSPPFLFVVWTVPSPGLGVLHPVSTHAQVISYPAWFGIIILKTSPTLENNHQAFLLNVPIHQPVAPPIELRTNIFKEQ